MDHQKESWEENGWSEHIQEEAISEGEVVSYEQAQKEISKWLDMRRVSPMRRKSAFKREIERLEDAVMYGALIVNEDLSLRHVLHNPITNSKGTETLSELTYKSRVRVEDVDYRGIKNDDADGRMLAFISALTGVPKPILRKLDFEENSLAQTIAGFFY